MGFEMFEHFGRLLFDEVNPDIRIQHVFHQKSSRFCDFGCFRSAMKSSENLSRLWIRVSHEFFVGISTTTLSDFLTNT
jgi:hypothetical protein